MATRVFANAASGTVDGGSIHPLPDNARVLDWLDRDPCPRLIVNHDLAIYWANSAALSFLALGPDIMVADGRLRLAGKTAEERLVDFVGSIVLSGSLYLTSPECDDFLLVRAERLPSEATDPAVALTMNSRIWAASSVRFDDLEIAFQLTPREVEVVTLLARGHSVGAISGLADCTIETVRRHVKNIYLKVGASSREELLNRLHPFRW